MGDRHLFLGFLALQILGKSHVEVDSSDSQSSLKWAGRNQIGIPLGWGILFCFVLFSGGKGWFVFLPKKKK